MKSNSGGSENSVLELHLHQCCCCLCSNFPFYKNTQSREKCIIFSRISKVFPYGFILRFNAALAISLSIINIQIETALIFLTSYFNVVSLNYISFSFDVFTYCPVFFLRQMTRFNVSFQAKQRCI